MRPAVLLAVLAAAAAAQETPFLHAEGTSLESFSVQARLGGVDRATAAGLARSFARLQEEQHVVRRRFAELFRDEHLDLLRRYYAPELVRQQEAWYGEQDRRDYTCAVKSAKEEGRTATARLESAWLDARGRPGGSVTVLALEQADGGWRIAGVRDDVPGQGLVERGLGVPPVTPEGAPVPAPAPPDLSTPQAAVRALHADVRRLGALRYRASLSLQRHYFAILEAFYGKEAAERARAERPRPEPQPEIVIETAEPEPRVGDMARVRVLVNEVVPGAKDLRSAVGEAAFDLRPRDGKWRVVNELRRPAPDKAFTPLRANFALVFLVGGSAG